LLAQIAGGVETCPDYRLLLNRGDIDAVVLALHPEVSVNVAIDFLRYGKPVLDEKPLATNLNDARRLMKSVEETMGVYQIGFVFGYADQVRLVGDVAKRIGTPALCRVAIRDEKLDRGNAEHFNRIQSILKTSSAITHEGSHVVDFAKAWNPSPYVNVNAKAFKTEADFAGPNVWVARFDRADGSVLDLEVAWLLPDFLPSELSIEGPGGSMRLEPFFGLGEVRIGGKTESLVTPPLRQPWAKQLDGFAASIDAGRSLTAPIQRGWDALAATKAAEESAQSGLAVTIEPR
jgi:predicted dehydrogenase